MAEDGMAGIQTGQPVGGKDSAGAFRLFKTDTSGRVQTQPGAGGASTGTESNVASSGTNVTILAANSGRIGGTVYNDSTQVLYLLLGVGPASSTVYTVQMAAAGYYEIPFGYTGILTGLWASANGSARVTELTA